MRFNFSKTEKRSVLRDLWLNYEIHYLLYNIQHRNPITDEVETFEFPKMFSRKTQRDAYEKNNRDTWDVLAIKEGQSLLSKNVGYWIGGKARKGIIIQNPLDVTYKEISKAEYDKLQEVV